MRGANRMAAGGKKKTRKKLSAEERKKRARERAFKRQARAIFSKSGFERVPEVADKEFEYQDSTSDFDDLFVSENIIVLAEYTLSNESGTGEHFKKKRNVQHQLNSWISFHRTSMKTHTLGIFPLSVNSRRLWIVSK